MVGFSTISLTGLMDIVFCCVRLLSVSGDASMSVIVAL